MNVGRDYIVEYTVGQFQHGSLVLRFADDPSDAQIRTALVDHGLKAASLQEVSARPLGTARAPQPVAAPAPALPRASRRRGGWILIPVAVGLFGLGMMRAGEAADLGQEAGQRPYGDIVEYCADRLEVARSFDYDGGILDGMVSTWPTAFAPTPANAAFMAACLGEASGSG